MRLYNGCPDDELKALWEERKEVYAEAFSLDLWITYFPLEGKYAVSRSIFSSEGYAALSDLHDTPRQALEEAKRRLAASPKS